MTSKYLNQLNINKLSKEQYEQAKESGTLSPDEIYLTPSEVDEVPTYGSENFVTSNGIKLYVDSKSSAIQEVQIEDSQLISSEPLQLQLTQEQIQTFTNDALSFIIVDFTEISQIGCKILYKRDMHLLPQNSFSSGIDSADRYSVIFVDSNGILTIYVGANLPYQQNSTSTTPTSLVKTDGNILTNAIPVIDYLRNSQDVEQSLAQDVSEKYGTFSYTDVVDSLYDGIHSYQFPSGGIPLSDLSASVQTSLSKADTALQTAPVESVNGLTGEVNLNGVFLPTTWINNSSTFTSTVNIEYWGDPSGIKYVLSGNVSDAEKQLWNSKYSIPDGGIPTSDLSDAVNQSLSLANTALQSIPNTYRTAQDQDAIDETKMPNIQVTSADNGKFLRVINGQWQAYAMPNADDYLF